MTAREAALRALRRFSTVDGGETDSETTPRRPPDDARDDPETVAPGRSYEPLPVDYDLAVLLGPEGCRTEFLGATWLVDPSWCEVDAIAALSAWYGRDVGTLEPVEWIVGAAHADEVSTWRSSGDPPA